MADRMVIEFVGHASRCVDPPRNYRQVHISSVGFYIAETELEWPPSFIRYVLFVKRNGSHWISISNMKLSGNNYVATQLIDVPGELFFSLTQFALENSDGSRTVGGTTITRCGESVCYTQGITCVETCVAIVDRLVGTN